jgi:KDO2-lipid IV(A) lauroyltransferase
MTDPAQSSPTFRHQIEAAVARAVLAGLARLSPARASAIGGFMARHFLSLLPFSRRANENLQKAMPELSAMERRQIIRDMWECLGRVTGELPHTKSMHIDNVGPVPIEVRGREHVEAAAATGKAVLFASAHMANWELLPQIIRELGQPIHVVYRAANNPLFDKIIEDLRGNIALGTVPKGATGARQLLSILKRGESVGMLIDQKMNDGIAVPFFGRPAMTAPAIARLARGQDLPIIAVHCERLSGPSFRVTFSPIISAKRSGDREQDILAVMTELNMLFEGWIRQHPGQWLWLHHRWAKPNTKRKRKKKRVN